MQVRKHSEQMTNEERHTVYNRLRSLNLNFDNVHIKLRAGERAVTQDDVQHAAFYGNIIEVSRTERDDYRVLVRDYTKRPNTVACISLKTGAVITGWYNHSSDGHKSCKTEYNWQVDLTQLPLC